MLHCAKHHVNRVDQFLGTEGKRCNRRSIGGSGSTIKRASTQTLRPRKASWRKDVEGEAQGWLEMA